LPVIPEKRKKGQATFSKCEKRDRQLFQNAKKGTGNFFKMRKKGQATFSKCEKVACPFFR
jgi:hypothetical protein